MKTMFSVRALCFWLAICLVPQFLRAQLAVPVARPTIFDFLTRREGDTLQLAMNLSELLANRRTAAYFPAALTAPGGQSFALEVRTRGKFRRKTSEVPPLKLKFSKKTLEDAGLDTLNEIKLVLPQTFDAKGEELVLREYIAYRMYEKLTPVSFRARLIRLRLDDQPQAITRWSCALLLEHEEEVAARQHSQVAEVWGLPKEGVDMDQAALTVLFEFLIGNTDWEMVSSRNMLFLRSLDNGKMRTMPYDFDFSGLVSAPYASPNSTTGLKNVQDRCLMAQGIAPESLRRAVEVLKAARKDLTELCASRYLSKNVSDQLIAYLSIFFDAVERNPELPATLIATKH